MPATPAALRPPAHAARRLLAPALLALAAGCAPLPPAPGPGAGAPGAPQPGMVSVTFDDPAGFAEARERTPHETPAARQAWAQALASYLAERAAAQLPPEQRLQVHLTDVRRAGRHDPAARGGAAAVRLVSELEPPRIDLRFTLRTADGRVLRSGTRQLREPAFLRKPGRDAADPLRHEKALLDAWLAREFAPTTPTKEPR